MLKAGEIVVDNFAGGGGASTGIELGLRRHVDIAINHDPAAIDMHRMNHPETEHYCESVWDVDPVEACRGRPVGLAWFSPDCKHFSKAKGNRPVDKNIRGLAWVSIRWAALVPVRIMMMENVEEFMSWGPVVERSPGKWMPCQNRAGETFEAFKLALSTGLPKDHPAWTDIREAFGDNFPYERIEEGLGYDIEHKILRACDYGTPTIRKRFFLVARNDSLPIEWPAPTHGDIKSGLIQYATAADVIDWSIPVKSIFNRKKPLADKTMMRIAKGIKRFVLESDAPFIVGEQLAMPFITECANASSQRNMAADEPLRTICAQVKGGHFALVSAFLSKYCGDDLIAGQLLKFHGKDTGAPLFEPMPTVLTKSKQALVTSHLIKLRGTCQHGQAVSEPMPTVTAGGFHVGEVRAFLLKYYGTNIGHPADEPLQTITTKHRFGLVMVRGEAYQIADIGMRMLEPHELFAAQGFPNDYQISHDSTGKKISKASQVARCGNAVCPPVAQALVEANINPAHHRVAA